MNRTELKALVKQTAADGGKPARTAFLAYAFFRGRVYRDIELIVREHNEPSPTAIAAVFGEATPVQEVKVWLAVPATPEATKRHAEARDAALVKKRERSEAARAAFEYGETSADLASVLAAE